jgi:Tfp pilus assembly protein PilV
MKPFIRRPRDRRLVKARAGMSIVELIVAIVLLGVGLLAMAALSVVLSAQTRHSRTQQVAAMVVQSRLDSLSSIHCQNLASSGTQTGTTITRGVTEKWSIADGNDTKIIRDTVTFTGRKNPLAYISIIPCRD